MRTTYFETPYYILGGEIIALDQAVWEIRRFARVLDYEVMIDGKKVNLLKQELAANERAAQRSPHKFQIIDGRLEQIISDTKHPAREALLWQNAFFGRKPRKTITLPGRAEGGNSPLSLHPQILDEVLKYVFLPKDVRQAYRNAISASRDTDAKSGGSNSRG